MQFKSIKKRLGVFSKKMKFFLHYSKRLKLKGYNTEKRIIVCCDGLFPHGGLVDRLKGIMSFYEISKVLDYKFYIQFDKPFELKVLLEPNKVNWFIGRKDIKWHPTKTKLVYLVNNFNVNPLEIIKRSKANTFIVYANIDYFERIYNTSTNIDLENKWRISFNELFKRTEFLNTKLESLENKNYIAIHTRFTSLMGDFTDSSVKIISEEKKRKLLVDLQFEINKILKESKHKCYVFSDSTLFLQYIANKENIHLVEGNPFHMDDYNNISKLEDHLKTMLDFFMIANSETVYFLKIKPMYHSSFSKYAALIGNKPFKVISR